MSIRDKKNINVINYNDNPVCVSTRDESYAIEAAIDNAQLKYLLLFLKLKLSIVLQIFLEMGY